MKIVLAAMVVIVLTSVALVLSDDEAQTPTDGARVEASADGPQGGMQLPDASGEVRSLDTPRPDTDTDSDASDVAASSTGLPDSAAAPTRILGRVTHAADGRPAAAAHLTILWEPANPEAERLAHPGAPMGNVTRAEMRSTLRSLGPTAFETSTDDDGRYTFTIPEIVRTAVRFSGVEVAAGPTTPRQVVREEHLLSPGTETVFDVSVLSGCVLSGTVVDTAGRPVAGATVDGFSVIHGVPERVRETPDRSVTSDGSGAFTLGAMGEEFTLSASAEGMAPHLLIQGKAAHDETIEGLQLMVSAEREALGSVVDGSGAPLAGVTITADARIPTSQRITQFEEIYGSAPPRVTSSSGQGGRFRLEGLCQRSYSVRVEHEGYQEWIGAHAPEDADLSIQLTAGLQLTGTVTRLDGTPLAGARVRMGSGADMSANNGFTETDEAGQFMFESLTPDLNAYVVARAGGLAVHVEQPVTIEEGGLNHVNLVLRPERRLAGIVVDPAGNPLEGVKLTIQGDRLIDLGGITVFPVPTWESQFGAVVSHSDATGAFRFGNLYDGTFRITATAPVDNLRAVLDARSGSEDLRIVLDPGATVGVTLSGVARDGVTGLPLRDTFYVTPMFGNGGGYSGTSHSFKDPEGRYRITALTEGSMLLNASAEGYAPWSGGAHTVENGDYRFDIAFLPERRVKFRVVDGNGKPVVVNMGFTDQQGESLMVEYGPGGRMTNLTTDEKGEAIAGGLPAALITINAKRGWLGARQEYVVDLRPEPRGPIELVYGEPEMRTLLVLVLTGAPTEPEPVGQPGWKIGSWLEEQVSAGNLRPLGVPVEVRATDETGVEVAATSLDPAGENAQAFPIKGVDLPFVSKLELPARTLTIRAEADGHAVATRAWDPEGIVEIMVVVLRPES